MARPSKSTSPTTDRAITDGLATIYRNTDGTLPDISHLEVRRRGRWRGWLSITLIAVVGAGLLMWAAQAMLNPAGSTQARSISLVITGPQNIASGDEVGYEITYRNIDRVALRNLDIIIRYPDGFTFTSSQPEATNDFHTTWHIGDLARGGTGTIIIRGQMVGAVGLVKTINATASFQPENFSSTFKELASYASQITSSIIDLKLEGPAQTLTQKQATYVVKYRNLSNQAIANIKIVMTYPSNFIFTEAQPATLTIPGEARSLHNQWLIKTLEPKQEGQIEIKGGFVTDDKNPEAILQAQIGFIEPITDTLSVQQQESMTTTVISQPVTVTLVANGSDQPQPVAFGQTVNYTVTYRNTSMYDIHDATLSLTLDAAVLDWATLTDTRGGILAGHTITWTKEQLAGLDVLRPLDQVAVTVGINVKAASGTDARATNLQAKAKASVRLGAVGDLDAGGLVIESNEIVSTVTTDVQVTAEGHYFDDDNMAVGTGPLPPVVGQTSTFRIMWSVTNSAHDMNGVTVSTILPSGVSWVGKSLASVGSVAYNAKTKTVSWTINKIAANTGRDTTNVWFDVAVTPTADQVKKLLILTDQTTLTGTDVTTGSTVTKLTRGITSNLEGDTIGGGKGLVIDIAK